MVQSLSFYLCFEGRHCEFFPTTTNRPFERGDSVESEVENVRPRTLGVLFDVSPE